jgi:hypothetical protein
MLLNCPNITIMIMHLDIALGTKMRNCVSQDIIYSCHTVNIQVILMIILATRMYSKHEETRVTNEYFYHTSAFLGMINS